MTTHDHITTWAAAGESEAQEFKRTTGQRRDAARAVCAMLNHRGGRVLFGVEPDGRIVGQQASDHTLEEVAQELREIEPPVFPTIERVVVGAGREVLVVSVGTGYAQPYTHRGQAYRRVGTTNQVLSREEYNRVLLERLHADSRWELQPAAGWSAGDLDHEEIRRTLEAGIEAGRIEDPDTRDPQAILRGLGLVKQDVLLRAAVVLFGRSDRLLPDFAQCLLRVARFRGTEKGEFLDNRQFHGHAFDLFQRAQRFLLDHMPIAGRFEPHESRPWNPLIASVFYRRGIIETWGQGTLKMAAWTREAGLPSPEILEVPGAVVVRFRAKAIGKTTGKTTGKTIGKTPCAVLELLSEDPNLTVRQLAASLEKSELTIHRAIRTLRESGRLRRIGPAKGGHWEVIE